MAGIAGLTERHHTVLHRLLRVAYPHDRFPDGPYERAAVVIVEALDGAGLTEIAAGLDGLDDACGGDFTALDEDAATAQLHAVEDAPFFVAVRAAAVVALYDDREVWALLGYEGSAYEHGGYVERGFDDLDWLPDPRITESDAPRIEIAEVSSA